MCIGWAPGESVLYWTGIMQLGILRDGPLLIWGQGVHGYSMLPPSPPRVCVHTLCLFCSLLSTHMFPQGHETLTLKGDNIPQKYTLRRDNISQKYTLSGDSIVFLMIPLAGTVSLKVYP